MLGMGTDFDGISKSPKDLEDIGNCLSSMTLFQENLEKKLPIKYSIKICRSFLRRICKIRVFTL